VGDDCPPKPAVQFHVKSRGGFTPNTRVSGFGKTAEVLVQTKWGGKSDLVFLPLQVS